MRAHIILQQSEEGWYKASPVGYPTDGFISRKKYEAIQYARDYIKTKMNNGDFPHYSFQEVIKFEQKEKANVEHNNV